MDFEQLKSLCKRLEENDPSLLTVDLTYENLGVDGASLLAEALHQNRVVNSVSIRYSGIGFDGTQKILTALKGRGIKTRLQVMDDYSETEYETLLQMGPETKRRNKPQKEVSKVEDGQSASVHGSKESQSER